MFEAADGGRAEGRNAVAQAESPTLLLLGSASTLAAPAGSLSLA